MSLRLALLSLIVLALGCESHDQAPVDAEVADATPDGTRRCGQDGDSIEQLEAGTWQVVSTCGEDSHCTVAYCVCDPGDRCTGAGTAEACCGNDTEGPVEGCGPVDPGLDNRFLPIDRALVIASAGGPQRCSSPAGTFRACGPSSVCTEVADDSGVPEAQCACTPSATCIPLDCAEGTFQVTVECPQGAPPVYTLCEG
jgi:hypothetical protein